MRLWRIVEDTTLAGTTRLGAAVALSGELAESERAPLRVVAGATVLLVFQLGERFGEAAVVLAARLGGDLLEGNARLRRHGRHPGASAAG
jgi:hypothetical protein